MTSDTQRALTSGGFAWGPERVALGISIRRLSELSGVNRGTLSLVEQGRLVPSGADYQKVMRALADLRKVHREEGWALRVLKGEESA